MISLNNSGNRLIWVIIDIKQESALEKQNYFIIINREILSIVLNFLIYNLYNSDYLCNSVLEEFQN